MEICPPLAVAVARKVLQAILRQRRVETQSKQCLGLAISLYGLNRLIDGTICGKLPSDSVKDQLQVFRHVIRKRVHQQTGSTRGLA